MCETDFAILFAWILPQQIKDGVSKLMNFDTPTCFCPDGEGAVSHRPVVAWLSQEWFQMAGA